MRTFALLAFIFSQITFAAIDLEALEKELKGKGLEGEVHGATQNLSLYVFVYRNPQNFFEQIEFPLITEVEKIQEELKNLQRHDRIKIRGRFATFKAPIRHIEVDDLVLVKKFENVLPVPTHQYKAKIPKELIGKKSFLGKVHAVYAQKNILVVEYKDAVLPVYVENGALLKDLYRNDKIEIAFTIRQNPGSPVHIELDTTVKNPLKVTDSMKTWHGKKKPMEGYLVLFPKSPQVLFNVFALHDVDQNGVERQFTLVHFDDVKVFEKIRIQLQEWWDKHPEGVKNIRNKYVNTKVKIQANGTFNVVDPGQANPQIVLSGPESLTLLE